MHTRAAITLLLLLCAAAHAGPRHLSVPVPEGNRLVTLTLSTTTQPATITVKAETRRLMIDRLTIPAGQTITRTFIVNTRTPALPDGRQVKLNPREVGTSNWDDRLELEFLGDTASLEVKTKAGPAPLGTPTIFLAGDSTVCDQAGEPYHGWGQMLPAMLKPDVAVANYAESGRSLTSFEAELRLAKILSVARPGDFLFIQFAHNDMKERGDGVGAFGNYSDNLRRFIAQARAKGMTPVVVTSMHRRQFDDAGRIKNTFGNYIDAARKVAIEQKVTLIDLNAMSAAFYEAMGPTASARAFVHYPADTFPNQPEPLKDNTHHNAYGAYELAKCIVEGMRTSGDASPRALLPDDVRPFDPATPDDVDAFDLPASPPTESTTPTTKPAGS